MTISPIRPGLTVRDSQILDLLLAGVPKSHITERGLYRRTWNAADVERVAAAQVITAPTGQGYWKPPLMRSRQVTVTIPPRVAMVLDGVCEGLANAQIATRMGVSEHTVKTQMRTLLRLLGAKDRAHAAALVCSGQVAVVVGRAGRSQAGDTAVENADGSAA